MRSFLALRRCSVTVLGASRERRWKGRCRVSSTAWDQAFFNTEPDHNMGNHDTRDTRCSGCGQDHPLRTGETGEAKLAVWDAPGYWTPASDPRAQAALDDLYLEAWLDG